MDYDPIEDIVTNDEEDDGVGPAYNVYHYWEEESYCQFEAMMDLMKYEIWEEKTYGHLRDAADAYYEELDRLEDAVNAAVHDPMANLLHSMHAAEMYGCGMDKSFAYEGFALLDQESAEDNFGDGDPSQWTY